MEELVQVENPPQIPLPSCWTKHVRVVMLHVVALAQYATAYTRGWASHNLYGRIRLRTENERLQQEIEMLREEIRIKDVRMMLIMPQRRPHYPPVERMSGLLVAGHSKKPRTRFW